MMPELQALIEAAGKWRDEARLHQVVGPLATAICAAYDAYQQSLTTPPSCLPPAPQPTVEGMALRDWFAGRAMQALISGPMGCQVHDEARNHYGKAAEWAYAQADAMIEARKGGSQ